ncbi:uncharacterized protein LOC143181410 [Calliopsis andreniformis]|uniref:uncharacterized protein LOC143181410 n=1 Tax=Calliopsis andreniformis TaxID=337506 RepID=UPI003FCDFAFF
MKSMIASLFELIPTKDSNHTDASFFDVSLLALSTKHEERYPAAQATIVSCFSLELAQSESQDRKISVSNYQCIVVHISIWQEGNVDFNASLLLVVCILLASSAKTSGNQTLLYIDEVRGLSELPMTELIHIKSTLVGEEDSIEDDQEPMEMSSRSSSLSLPMALPLKRFDKKPLRRYGEHYDEKGKDSKISKIFQLAVTALSFLAFGGYLMTLIITAIRRNSGNMTSGGNVILLSNLQGLQSYNRPKRNVLVFDPMENDFEIERLYQGMRMLSRSYAMYN